MREATAPIYSGFVRLHGAAERGRAERWAARQAAKASLPERHGGVLALAALVSLAPYSVPCWLPALLERLAAYFNAPQPIKGVVTKAFADFKRTHQDNWAAHKERLTYEQQELISDMLISPSFYA